MDIYIQIIKEICHDNKYRKWYIDLMIRAKNRSTNKKEAKNKLGYVESHHIIPRSFGLGGETDKTNIVFLTAREHLICHILLLKSVMNKNHYYKCREAVAYFNNNKNRKIIFNVKEIAWVRESNGIASSERNKNNQYYKYRNERRPETTEKRKITASNSKWVNNGVTEHFVTDYERYIELGYVFGRNPKPISEKKLQKLKGIEERKQKRIEEKEQRRIEKELKKLEKKERAPMSEEGRKNISIAAKNRKRRPHSEETKRKIGEGNKGKKVSDETKKKLSIIATNRNPTRTGAILSEETKNKISISNTGKPAWNKGKKTSEEQRTKLREINKNRQKILCPHCNKSFDPLNFRKWHGDKCKAKINS